MTHLTVVTNEDVLYVEPAGTHIATLYPGPQGPQGLQGPQGPDGAVAGYMTTTTFTSTVAAMQAKLTALEDATTDWIEPPRSGSWVNFVGDVGWRKLRCRKIDGMVYLEGLVGNHTLISTLICTLPVGYRPIAGNIVLPTITGYTETPGRVDVLTNGEVHHSSGDYDWVSFNGLCFATV